MLRVSTLRSVHEIDALRSRWQSLAAETPDSTIFQTFDWNRLAAQMFADREEPWVIHAVSDSGEAIIPAARRKDDLGLIGEALFDYRDVLCVGAPVVLNAAFRRLAEACLPFRVTAVRGQVAGRWPEAVLVPFAGAPRAGAAALDASSFRRQQSRLASRARRLPRKGFVLRRYDAPPSPLVRELYGLKAQQATGELFADAKRREFMCSIAHASGKDCCLWTYEDSAGPIAALLSFRHGNTRHFYTTWYDSEFSELSPGQALLFEATAQTLSEGLDSDFMTGEYLYKNRLATDVVPLFRVDARAEDVAQLASGRLQALRRPKAA
jgi:CelD/BcsL family acetyltransferase involved in cellulose biosynthesis